MRYDKRSATDAGAELLSHSLAVKKRTVIDYLIISDTQPNSDVDVDSVQLSDFGNYLAYPVSYIKKPDAKTFQPGAVMSNYSIPVTSNNAAYLTNIHNDSNGNQVGDLNNPLTVNMVGTIGHTDGEQNSTLITAAFANTNDAITMPAKTDIPYKLTFDFAVKLDNDVDNLNVTINVNNAGMVNFADLESILSDYIHINNDGTVNQSVNFVSYVQRNGIDLVDNNQLQSNVSTIWSDAANKEYAADHASDIGSLNNRFDQYTSSANVLQSNAVNNMSSLNNRFDSDESSANVLQSNAVINMSSLNNRFASEESTRASAVSGAVVGIDSNTTRIATEENTRASVVGSLATNISNAFQARGQYDGNLLDVALLPDGYYTILNNFTNAPAGFSGYGYFVKKVVGTDFYIELYDNANHHWTNHWGNHKWDGWMQVPDTNGVFQNRGLYQGNLLEIASLPDGYYQLIANTNNAPTGFSGYGIFVKQTVGADYYVTLIQADNTEWKAHTYNGNWNFWIKVANETDLTNLQNQINAIKSKLGM